MMYVHSKNRNWETEFAEWSRSPDQTQLEKCERAVQGIKLSIEKHAPFRGLSISTFAQGSYKNRTNVRKESDVDTCVLCTNVFLYSLPTGVTLEAVNASPIEFTYSYYKNEVEMALRNHFGYTHVTRGNKAFDIHETVYRVDADAAPCFEYRQYFRDSFGALKYFLGTALITDQGQNRITNFPEQQHRNGVIKNDETGRRFKKAVRIIKCLRNEMDKLSVPQAKTIPSYLIECIIWNVPNMIFNHITLRGMVNDLLAHIWVATQNDQSCAGWMEENNIKYLFGPHQEWTRQQVNDFIAAAWTYIENQ